MADPNLNELVSRAERRYFSDGIAEIVMGGLWLTWGAIILAPALAPSQRFGGVLKWAGLAALLIGAFAAQRLMRTLKARWTALRTGYIEPRRPSKGRNAMAAVSGFGASALISLVLARGGMDAKTLLAPAIGLLLACGFAIGQARGFTPSGWFYSAVCVAASALLAAFRIGPESGVAILFIALGTAAVGAGSWRFANYVRTHPEARHG